MSSSSNHATPQVHRRQSHVKRPFAACDSHESDHTSLHVPAHASGSGSSGSSRQLSSNSGSSGPGIGRTNKRARSTSSSDSDHSFSSDSSGYDTAQSSAHGDLRLDAPPALSHNVAIPHPLRDEERNLDLPQPTAIPSLASAVLAQNNTSDTLDRFSTLIPPLRSSVASSRSPSLPPVEYSEDAPATPPIHTMSSDFPSISGGDLLNFDVMTPDATQPSPLFGGGIFSSSYNTDHRLPARPPTHRGLSNTSAVNFLRQSPTVLPLPPARSPSPLVLDPAFHLVFDQGTAFRNRSFLADPPSPSRSSTDSRVDDIVLPEDSPLSITLPELPIHRALVSRGVLPGHRATGHDEGAIIEASFPNSMNRRDTSPPRRHLGRLSNGASSNTRTSSFPHFAMPSSSHLSEFAARRRDRDWVATGLHRLPIPPSPTDMPPLVGSARADLRPTSSTGRAQYSAPHETRSTSDHQFGNPLMQAQSYWRSSSPVRPHVVPEHTDNLSRDDWPRQPHRVASQWSHLDEDLMQQRPSMSSARSRAPNFGPRSQRIMPDITRSQRILDSMDREAHESGHRSFARPSSLGAQNLTEDEQFPSSFPIETAHVNRSGATRGRIPPSFEHVRPQPPSSSPGPSTSQPSRSDRGSRHGETGNRGIFGRFVRSRRNNLSPTSESRTQFNTGDGRYHPRAFHLPFTRHRPRAGDFVPDEVFDTSYEALLSLSDSIGEAQSRATPAHVIASLPSASYREWANQDSESRCPICLDDYEPRDVVTKLVVCPHWLHKHCLEQWLRTANTCPVCRKEVDGVDAPSTTRTSQLLREPRITTRQGSNAEFSSTGTRPNRLPPQVVIPPVIPPPYLHHSVHWHTVRPPPFIQHSASHAATYGDPPHSHYNAPLSYRPYVAESSNRIIPDPPVIVMNSSSGPHREPPVIYSHPQPIVATNPSLPHRSYQFTSSSSGSVSSPAAVTHHWRQNSGYYPPSSGGPTFSWYAQ